MQESQAGSLQTVSRASVWPSATDPDLTKYQNGGVTHRPCQPRSGRMNWRFQADVAPAALRNGMNVGLNQGDMESQEMTRQGDVDKVADDLEMESIGQ